MSAMGQIRNEASDISVTDIESGYRIVIGSGGKENLLSS